MIIVRSQTGGVYNMHFKNKSELINDLMSYGGGFDEEEEAIAIEQGFKSLEDKFTSWKVYELVNLFEQLRG